MSQRHDKKPHALVAEAIAKDDDQKKACWRASYSALATKRGQKMQVLANHSLGGPLLNGPLPGFSHAQLRRIKRFERNNGRPIYTGIKCTHILHLYCFPVRSNCNDQLYANQL